MLACTHGDSEGHGERMVVVSPELRAALVGARPLFIYERWQVSSGLFSWCSIKLPTFCSKVSPSRAVRQPQPRGAPVAAGVAPSPPRWGRGRGRRQLGAATHEGSSECPPCRDAGTAGRDFPRCSCVRRALAPGQRGAGGDVGLPLQSLRDGPALTPTLISGLWPPVWAPSSLTDGPTSCRVSRLEGWREALAGGSAAGARLRVSGRAAPSTACCGDVPGRSRCPAPLLGGMRNPTVPRIFLHGGGRWSAPGHNSQSKPHVSWPRYGGESKTSGTRRKHALAGSAGGRNTCSASKTCGFCFCTRRHK